MDRTVRIAIIAACVTVTVAAIVVAIVVVTRSPQDRPPEGAAKTEENRPAEGVAETEETTPPDPKAASGSSKVQEACEAARLKLLQGEVTDFSERVALDQHVEKYCEGN